MNLSCVDDQFCGSDDEQVGICGRTSSGPVGRVYGFGWRCLGCQLNMRELEKKMD